MPCATAALAGRARTPTTHARVRSSNTFTNDEGLPATPGYRRLARVQHWRVCPNCKDAVEQRPPDGSARCVNCMHKFRWLDAPLVIPAATLGQLLVEFRWMQEGVKPPR